MQCCRIDCPIYVNMRSRTWNYVTFGKISFSPLIGPVRPVQKSRSVSRAMVKHKQRRMDQALHAFRLENEKKQLEKIEARKKKNEEKKKQMITDQVGENGEVKAMTIKYKGTFDFSSSARSGEDSKDEEMYEPEDITGWVKSQRKKNGLEISKR